MHRDPALSSRSLGCTGQSPLGCCSSRHLTLVAVTASLDEILRGQWAQIDKFRCSLTGPQTSGVLPACSWQFLTPPLAGTKLTTLSCCAPQALSLQGPCADGFFCRFRRRTLPTVIDLHVEVHSRFATSLLNPSSRLVLEPLPLAHLTLCVPSVSCMLCCSWTRCSVCHFWIWWSSLSPAPSTVAQKKISNLVLDRSQSRELFVFVVQLNIGWVSCLPGRLELDLSCSTSFNAGIAFHVERGTCIIMSSISFGSMSAVVEVCVRPQKHSSRHPTSVSVSSFTCEVAACVQSFESVDHQLHR